VIVKEFKLKVPVPPSRATPLAYLHELPNPRPTNLTFFTAFVKPSEADTVTTPPVMLIA
jgi:hypothetical protein